MKMKKWNFLFMALLMSAAVMVTSCGGDDDDPIDPGPAISLKGETGYTSKDATILVDTPIKVGINGTKSTVSGKKLTRFKFSIVANNVPTTMFDTTFKSEVDSYTWTTELTFTGVGEAKLYFELWDKNNMKGEQSFNLTIEDPGTAVKKYADVVFGSWNDGEPSFFSSTEGINYTVNQTANTPANQAKIDFLYFYGATNKNTIASPDDADANSIETLKLNKWTKKNQTRFNPIDLTVAQFNAIGNSYKFPNFNFGSQSTKMPNLKVNDVFMFKTEKGKMGLVMITYLSKPNRGDTSKATIIVQE